MIIAISILIFCSDISQWVLIKGHLCLEVDTLIVILVNRIQASVSVCHFTIVADVIYLLFISICAIRCTIVLELRAAVVLIMIQGILLIRSCLIWLWHVCLLEDFGYSNRV